MYLSALAACLPKKPYTPSDDVESFFRLIVTLYGRFHEHLATSEENHYDDDSVLNRFSHYRTCYGVPGNDPSHTYEVGDRLRFEDAVNGTLPFTLGPEQFADPLACLVLDLNSLLQRFYRTLSWSKLRQWYGAQGIDGDDEDALRAIMDAPFNHDVLLEHLNCALRETGWKDKDKVDDQFKRHYGGRNVPRAVVALRTISAQAKRSAESPLDTTTRAKRSRSTASDLLTSK